MHQIILIGETATRIAEPFIKKFPDLPIVCARNIEEAQKNLNSTRKTDVLISRDAEPIPLPNLLQLTQQRKNYNITIIWPPDEAIGPYIQEMTEQASTLTKSVETVISPENAEKIQTENAELQARVTALESAIRSLVAALSQCDPWPEAYADDHETWEMIMQGIPQAGMAPDDDDEQQYTTDEDESDEE